MKVLMIVNTDGALYIFRRPIISKLISLGHEVISISSESRYFDKLKTLGVKPISLDIDRHSVSPIHNLLLIIRLYLLIKKQRPDIVHNFTHKPAIYGTIGAWFSGIRGIFVTITGLGTLFVHNDAKTKLMRLLLLIQYKIALKFATTVFFQNPDDMAYFISRKVIDPKKAVLTFGSGIDLNEYPFPSLEDVIRAKSKLGKQLGISILRKIIILFPARGVPEKGIFEFYEAARRIQLLEPDNYIFIHLGLVDEDTTNRISKNSIERFSADCGVYYLGFKDDFKFYMEASDIVVLPSYREGTPRSLIEALALGKAVVTTDMPGCSEIVIDGWNGYLCKVKDVNSLVAKIMSVDDDFISRAKARSRKYCEHKYDVRKLVETTLDNYKINIQ